MSATPLDIPEILTAVCSFVKETADTQSCRQVSKQWHRVFTPYFWWMVLMLNFRSIFERSYGRYDFINIEAEEQEEAAAEELRFYGSFCEDVLKYASWLAGTPGRTVSMDSFLGLVLLAGKRSDLRDLKYLRTRDVRKLTPYIPQWALPAAMQGVAWTNDFMAVGEDEDGNTLTALSTAVDLVLAIIKQNRGLETLKVGAPIQDRLWRWSSRVSIPDNGPLHRWWPCLRKLHIQQCSLDKDFLRILLDNTERLDRLWLTNVSINGTDNSNAFGSSTKSLRSLGLCRVLRVPLWVQLDFARAQTRLETLTVSVPVNCDRRLGGFLRPGEPSSVVVDDSYQPSVPTFQHLWRLNFYSPEFYTRVGSQEINTCHITNLIPTTASSTSSVSMTSTSPPTSTSSLTGLRRLELFSTRVIQGEMRAIISRHYTSLESIDLRSTNISGNDVLLILQRCARLQRLAAEHISFRYDICVEENGQTPYDLTQPWACHQTLTDLTLSLRGVFDGAVDLDLDNEEQDCWVVDGQKPSLNRQEQFLHRLGTLVGLQTLQLVTDEFLSDDHDNTDTEIGVPPTETLSTGVSSPLLASYTSQNGRKVDQSLNLCLSKGLGQLENLKQLEILHLRTKRVVQQQSNFQNFADNTAGSSVPSSSSSSSSSPLYSTSRAMRGAGAQEAEWMARHWPRLKVVKGMGHPQSAFMKRLRSLREDIRETDS